MKNRSVNINIDYKTGKCVLTSKIKGTVETMVVPISKLNSFWREYNRGYSSDFIEFGRDEMERDISHITKKYPDLKFSKDLIKNADPLIYELLYYWDLKHADPEKDVSYSLDYLRTVIQKFDDNDFSKSTKGTLEEKSKRVRMRNLKKAGIDISYKVGLFNTNSKLSLLDKINGIKIAKIQEKILGVKLENNVFMKNKTVQKSEVGIETNKQKAIKKSRNKKTKTMFSIFGKKEKTSQKETARWTSKIESKKDSFRNKKFVSKKDEAKKMAINGAVTLLVAGTLFNIGAISNIKKRQKENTHYDIAVTEHTQDSTKMNTNKSFDNVKEIKNNTPITFEVDTPITFEVDQEEENEVLYDMNASENVSKKTDEEKLNEFKEYAVEKYMEEFAIGKKPEIGDMLADQYYSENIDGSGAKGYFSSHPNYKISHINISSKKGMKKMETIRVDGKNLSEILAEHPECKDYSIHFVNSETGGGLGFITKSQLDSMIEKQIDSIVQSKTANNQELDYDMLIDL